MTIGRILPSLARRFLREERGIISVQNLFLTVACCAVGAAGLDVTHFYAARTQLQVAADTAAHAAIYTRLNGRTAEQATTAAMGVASYGIPASYGKVLAEPDIAFGTWDAATSKFTALPSGSPLKPSAARVTTSRAGDNPVESFLFRIVGIDEMDVSATAVYAATPDDCGSLQGLFANGEVTPNSNNTYTAGICVHSQVKVAEQNDPVYQVGSFVSAPGENVTCKNKCASFDVASRSGSYNLEPWLSPLRLTGTLAAETRENLLADVKAALPEWNWTGIDQNIVTTTLPKKDPLAPSSLSGAVTYIDCRSGGGTAELGPGTYSNMVLLLHNCPVGINSGDVFLQDAVIYTTSTDPKNTFHVKGSGLQVGTDTDCDGSGAAALLTRGGFDAPSKLKFNGGTVIALRDVQFASHFGWDGAGDSGRGMSIISGGTLNPQSNNHFRACPPDPDKTPAFVNYRLAL